MVIVSYHSGATLPRALASLTAIPDAWQVRVFLHDNSADADTIVLATELAGALRIPIEAVACTDNCGFGAGCNAAAAAGKGQHILFLNPDAEILAWPSDWHPGRGIIGPAIIDSRGRRQQLYGRSRTVPAEILRILSPRQARPDGRGYVSGASLLIDRQSFDKLGGFDESFFMYYEDIDLCIRATEIGIPVGLAEQWRVLHVGGASAAFDATSSIRSMQASARSSVYFHRKHGHDWRRFASGMARYFDVRARAARLQGRADQAERFRKGSAAYREQVRSDAAGM